MTARSKRVQMEERMKRVAVAGKLAEAGRLVGPVARIGQVAAALVEGERHNNRSQAAAVVAGTAAGELQGDTVALEAVGTVVVVVVGEHTAVGQLVGNSEGMEQV